MATKAMARVEWLDAARGLAIVLVVCYHGALMADAVGIAHPLWSKANTAVQLFRMPLFFFVSGILASSAIGRPWRQVAGPRIGLFLWLFVLWAAIETAFYAVLPSVRPGRPSSDVLDLLTMFVVPDNGIWYLYALVLFFVVSKATRLLPSWLVLGFGCLLSALAAAAPESIIWVWQDMAVYAVFFLAGTRLKALALSLTSRSLSLSVVLGLAVCTGLGMVVASFLDVLAVPGVRLMLSTLAVGSGIALCVRLCAAGGAKYLTVLGQQTLPIYVLHGMVLNGITILIGVFVSVPVPLAMSLFFPPIVVACGLGISLVLSVPLKRIPGAFTLPAPLVFAPHRE